MGALRRRHHALRLVDAGPRIRRALAQLGAQRLERRPVDRHRSTSQSSTTLPALPLAATSKASSNAVKGKRWVITGEMSRPACTSTDMAYQVSNIWRPKMPFTVSIEWMTVPQSNSMDALGRPEQRDLPAVRHRRDHRVQRRCRARHLQAHVESLDHAQLGHDLAQRGGGDVDGSRDGPHRASQLEPLTAEVGDDHVAGPGVPDDGRRHEADRACAGDEDVLASTGNASDACTALPKGSKMAATSGSTRCGCRHTFVAGTTTSSAKPPSRSMPMLTVLGHSWR